MVMESDVQFEDMFTFSLQTQQQFQNSIDLQIDMFLGISPLPIYMQGSFPDQKIGDVDFTRKNSIKSESEETNLNENKQDTYMPEESPLNQTCKTSNHHNFQKHTVTALRDLVRQSQFENWCQNQTTLKLTTKLWKQFLKIKGKSIMTKKFLSILFKDDIQSVHLLKPYGFKELFTELSEIEIQIAKNELRRLVVIFLGQKNIENHLEKRQLKRKQEFRLYLINFRRELESANIKKRISKQSSDWIIDNAKIFDCLN